MRIQTATLSMSPKYVLRYLLMNVRESKKEIKMVGSWMQLRTHVVEAMPQPVSFLTCLSRNTLWGVRVHMVLSEAWTSFGCLLCSLCCCTGELGVYSKDNAVSTPEQNFLELFFPRRTLPQANKGCLTTQKTRLQTEKGCLKTQRGCLPHTKVIARHPSPKTTNRDVTSGNIYVKPT